MRPRGSDGQQAKHERIDVLAEHISSRKDWGAYVNLMTEIRRAGVAQANELLADIGSRLERALRATEKESDS